MKIIKTKSLKLTKKYLEKGGTQKHIMLETVPLNKEIKLLLTEWVCYNNKKINNE